MGSGLRKGTGVTSGHPFIWPAFIVVSFCLGSERECWGPTVGCCSWCQLEVGPHSLSSHQSGLKSLLGWHIPELCGPNLGTWNTGGNWGPSFGGAFFRPLGVQSLASSSGGPCATSDRCTVGWGGLSQTSLVIMGAGVARSAPVHASFPMASLSGAIWGTGGAVALSCPHQDRH